MAQNETSHPESISHPTLSVPCPIFAKNSIFGTKLLIKTPKKFLKFPNHPGKLGSILCHLAQIILRPTLLVPRLIYAKTSIFRVSMVLKSPKKFGKFPKGLELVDIILCHLAQIVSHPTGAPSNDQSIFKSFSPPMNYPICLSSPKRKA